MIERETVINVILLCSVNCQHGGRAEIFFYCLTIGDRLVKSGTKVDHKHT
jgi:hypothetical protein